MEPTNDAAPKDEAQEQADESTTELAAEVAEREPSIEQEEGTVRVEDEDEEGKDEVGEEEMDAEIEAMKQRFKDMEEEVGKISTAIPKQVGAPAQSSPGQDERSIYVGNVDYSTTNEELKDFFVSCGSVVRVTILCDKWTGPKGYAYVEFKESQSVVNAMILNDSPFKGRQLKILPKRTNVPPSQRGGRGGGAGGARGAPRGEFAPRRPFRPGGFYSPRRPFRPRRAYHPYY